MDAQPRAVDATVARVIDEMGSVFAVFDTRTQDSGHVSYGIETPDGHRCFVKTAGSPGTSGGLTKDVRIAALRRAAALQADVRHPALVPIESVLAATDGVLVVYEWFDGELLYNPPPVRDDAASSGSRFRALPMAEVVRGLDAVIDVHVVLEAAGWVAGDFYDGSLMYEFARAQIKVIDLESYRRGPYVNEVGRLPGSTRFMAPEEFTRGALIDSRTTVYNLGRMLHYFLLDRHPTSTVAAVATRATADPRDQRPPTVADLQAEWRRATAG